jgi:hypothetical protein
MHGNVRKRNDLKLMDTLAVCAERQRRNALKMENFSMFIMLVMIVFSTKMSCMTCVLSVLIVMLVFIGIITVSGIDSMGSA